MAIIVRFPSIFEQGHADALPVHRCIRDHDTVARLKDVQGEIEGLGNSTTFGSGNTGIRTGMGNGVTLSGWLRPALLSSVIGLHGAHDS